MLLNAITVNECRVIKYFYIFYVEFFAFSIYKKNHFILYETHTHIILLVIKKISIRDCIWKFVHSYNLKVPSIVVFDLLFSYIFAITLRDTK